MTELDRGSACIQIAIALVSPSFSRTCYAVCPSFKTRMIHAQFIGAAWYQYPLHGGLEDKTGV